MEQLRSTIGKIANSYASVLITGESGSGKEVVAFAIHQSSPRKAAPFVTINCAAIPEQLLESELFGYVRGAFSGADPKGRMGKFELANGGSLFLDEIGDMPLHLQAKLLRVLQEKAITRVGSTTPSILMCALLLQLTKTLTRWWKIISFVKIFSIA